MLLTSAEDPSGPKSTKHYLVLHHNNRRKLVKLPESYSDLENEVKRLHHIDPGTFYVETEDLNICKGQRVEISKDDWEDIAQLLGVVHIVPLRLEDSSPEDNQQTELTAVCTPDKGVIALDSPLIKDELLVLDIGNIDFGADSTPSTKFNVQLLDESRNPMVSISIFSRSGSIFLNSPGGNNVITRPLKETFPLDSGHHITVFKQGNELVLLCDLKFVTSVQLPAHNPFTAVRYDRGTPSPFTGPISATVFSGLLDLRERFNPYRNLFGLIDKETLYQRILSCDQDDAPYILGSLASISGEATLFKSSSSGVKYRSSSVPLNVCTNFEWGLHPMSVFVIRFDFPQDVRPRRIILDIGRAHVYTACQIDISANDDVKVSEMDASHTCIGLHTFKLPFTIQSPGQHSFAFLNRGADLQVLFDYRKSVVFRNSTTLSRKPPEMHLQVPYKCNATIDVYQFD